MTTLCVADTIAPLTDLPVDRLGEDMGARGGVAPRLHWLEAEVFSQDENLAGLNRINRELLAEAEGTMRRSG